MNYIKLQSSKMFENLESRELQELTPGEKTAYSVSSTVVELIFYADLEAYDFQFIDTTPTR